MARELGDNTTTLQETPVVVVACGDAQHASPMLLLRLLRHLGCFLCWRCGFLWVRLCVCVCVRRVCECMCVCVSVWVWRWEKGNKEMNTMQGKWKLQVKCCGSPFVKNCGYTEVLLDSTSGFNISVLFSWKLLGQCESLKIDLPSGSHISMPNRAECLRSVAP